MGNKKYCTFCTLW